MEFGLRNKKTSADNEIHLLTTNRTFNTPRQKLKIIDFKF